MNKARIAHEIDGLQGKVLVDGFRYANSSIVAYFLTHFHGDHYNGLSSEFDGPGLIHCTKITARLVITVLGVKEQFVRAYEFGDTANVCGSKVTFLDANHCPGAALLLFDVGGCNTALHLHTGDMRYSPKMKEFPALIAARGKIDKVYLDTTYCHPKHVFRPQQDSITMIADAIRQRLEMKVETESSANQEKLDNSGMSPVSDETNQHACETNGMHGATHSPSSRRDCLFLLSAYKIGKERVLLEVARRTGLKIFVDEAKMKVLECLEFTAEESSWFTTNIRETPIHVCKMGFAGEMWPFFRPNFSNLENYLREHALPYAQVLAFIPTGWADGSNYNKRNAIRAKGPHTVQLVPYSEHSNYTELLEFVSFLRPRQVVPTVFEDEKAARTIVARFANLVDRSANLKAFVSTISKSGGSANGRPLKRARSGDSNSQSPADTVQVKDEECTEVEEDAAPSGAEAERPGVCVARDLDSHRAGPVVACSPAQPRTVGSTSDLEHLRALLDGESEEYLTRLLESAGGSAAAAAELHFEERTERPLAHTVAAGASTAAPSSRPPPCSSESGDGELDGVRTPNARAPSAAGKATPISSRDAPEVIDLCSLPDAEAATAGAAVAGVRAAPAARQPSRRQAGRGPQREDAPAAPERKSAAAAAAAVPAARRQESLLAFFARK